MYKNEKKVTVECVNDNSLNREFGEFVKNQYSSNPMKGSNDSLSEMVKNVLDKELPMLKNNSLLHDLVLYSLQEKMKTVQTLENVLSYIKVNKAKQIEDVSFKNGEVRIKCSI